MNRVTPTLRNFAEHLIAFDSKARKPSIAAPVGAFTVIETLRPHLTNLMGNAGFSALLARALVLSTAEIPSLRLLQVDADGTWKGMAALQAQLNQPDFSDARAVVLGQLLGLLGAFVGDALTQRLVSDVWPTFSLNELDSNMRGKNAKTK